MNELEKVKVSKLPEDMTPEELTVLVYQLKLANDSLMAQITTLEEDLLFWQSLLGVAIFKHGENQQLTFTDELSEEFLKQKKPYVWYSQRNNILGEVVHRVELLTDEEFTQKNQEIKSNESDIVIPGKSSH